MRVIGRDLKVEKIVNLVIFLVMVRVELICKG